LAETLTKDDPIRIAIRWSRGWYLPASGSEPEVYRPIPDSGTPIEKTDTLKSLRIDLYTPAGRRYRLRPDIADRNPDGPSWHRLCTTLLLTITEDALSEAGQVRGKWISGKIAGLHELGWFSIRIEGWLAPLGRKDLALPFGSDFFHIKRVADGRKTLAEIDAIAQAKVAELCGVAHPRGLPGGGVPTAVIELENGSRQAMYAVWGHWPTREDLYTVELTPKGDPIRVTVCRARGARGEERFHRLFQQCPEAKTLWPKVADDR
jgi:hypothetical protein